jgi:hypothetical protein
MSLTERSPGTPGRPAVTVYLLRSADLARALVEGPAHPVLGGLIDIGTCVPLEPAKADVHSVVADACVDLAATGPTTVRRADPLGEGFRAEVEARASRGPVFVVVVDPAGHTVPFVLAAGPELPAMGLLPPCGLDRVVVSLRFASGTVGVDHGETIFTEPAFAADAVEEERLSDRLRQLYGE